MWRIIKTTKETQVALAHANNFVLKLAVLEDNGTTYYSVNLRDLHKSKWQAFAANGM